MSTTTVSIQPGPKLFAFATFAEWVNKARSWYRTGGVATHDTVAVDAAGRICTRGKHFMRADKEQTFPVTVYAVDCDPTERIGE